MSAKTDKKRTNLINFVERNENYIKEYSDLNNGLLPRLLKPASSRMKFVEGKATATNIKFAVAGLNSLAKYNNKNSDQIVYSPAFQEVINYIVEDNYDLIKNGPSKDVIKLYSGTKQYPVEQSGYSGEEEESATEPIQAVESSQLNDEFNDVITAAEGVSQGNTDYEKYESLLIDLNNQLGTKFESSNYDTLNEEQLLARIEALQELVQQEQMGIFGSSSFDPPTMSESTVISVMESLIDPSSGSFPQVEEMLLETVEPVVQSTTTTVPAASSVAATQPIEPLPIEEQAVDQPIEPMINEPTGSGGSGNLPYKERYHKFSLKTYFESDSYPKWDPTLEKNVIDSGLNETERIKTMDDIIKNYGPQLFIDKRIGSSKEELVELVELQFCILRNLHLGPRIYQSASVDLNQLNKVKSLANGLSTTSVNNQSVTPVELVNAQAIESQLTSANSSSAPGIQTEKEFKYEKAYDKYQETYARGVTALPIKKYEPTKVVVTETAQSIAGESSTIVSGELLKQTKKIQNYGSYDYMLDPINNIYY